MILDFTIGLLLAFILSGLSYYKKWLNRNGALVATVIGGIVWGIGVWKAALPLLFYFVSSSVLSLGTKTTSIINEKDNQPRDAWQVLCNGVVATACLLVYAITKEWAFMLGYWASLSISISDTWSSTIGTKYAASVIDITSGKPLMKGLSGGISWVGTVAGLAGAFILSTIGWVIYKSYFPVALITLTGFAGMILDSILGSVLQVKYVLADGSQFESIPQTNKASIQMGISWMNNDVVNILSNLIVVALMVVYLFYKASQ